MNKQQLKKYKIELTEFELGYLYALLDQSTIGDFPKGLKKKLKK